MDTQTEENKTIPVFVYGTLRKGYSNHALLNKAVFVTEGKTLGLYAMVAHNYPMVSRNERRANIVGEMYLVSKKEFACLDALEGYPRFYDREFITVKTAKGQTQAWMYFYDDGITEGHDVVATGDFADYAEEHNLPRPQ